MPTRFRLARRQGTAQSLWYVVSQGGDVLLASLLLRLIFPLHPTLGATLPTGGLLPSLVLEIVLTFFLMVVIIKVATGSEEQGLMAGIAIGGTLALSALAGGTVSGASLNPARSLAPALVSGNLTDLWLYLVAPCLGAALAVSAYTILHPDRRQ